MINNAITKKYLSEESHLLGQPKRRFLQEPHGVIFQKTPVFIVTDVKISNLTRNAFLFENQWHIIALTLLNPVRTITTDLPYPLRSEEAVT
jgi:hypothetical protein